MAKTWSFVLWCESGRAASCDMPGTRDLGVKESPTTPNLRCPVSARKDRAAWSRGNKEAPAGIEPANNGFADRCLTTWLRRRGEGS